ncbi:DUF3732 domain-containing protein [Vibrio diabolicus]|uniref:DUF3732 domain-containing protein n=1 Tax=Vibrio diabolicus TaxID=50719 RepID=UPI0038CD5CB7
MIASIDKIGAIDNFGKSHSVKFEQGLNIITGRSSTGKSALIEIFDYCFGSSEFNIPEGVITKSCQMYFVLINLAETKLLLGRKNRSSSAFIKEFENNHFDNRDVMLSDFGGDNFLTLKNFKQELNGYFGLDITDTDLDVSSSYYRGKKKPSPSVRSFMSFLLQHQNLVANKHAVFYRFDEKEKREQAIEHFKIFLGLVDQNYFLISKEIDLYKTELRKLELSAPRVDALRLKNKEKLRILFEQYEVLTGLPIEKITVDKAYTNPVKWLEEIQNIEVKVDSSSTANSQFIVSKEKERNKLICELRAEEKVYRDLCASISATSNYEEVISNSGIPLEVNEHVTKCPVCASESDLLEDESNALGDAIEWLNTELIKTPFVHRSFLSKRENVIKNIREKRNKLKDIDEKISAIEKQNKELKKRNSLLEQVTKLKLKIEAQLELLIEITPTSDLKEQIKKLRKKIKDKESKLSAYNVEKHMADIEVFINDTMNAVGENLDFEKDYKPINLKFSPTTFDIWYEPLGEKDKKIYLRSMGSGANWLYTHLALFLSLQGLFCKYKEKCLIPPILFLDQPTQVYFPNIISDSSEAFNANEMVLRKSGDEKTVDDDIQSVVSFFNEIITFCEKMKKDYSVMPQIIVTDHADNLGLPDGRNFESYVRERWRNRGFIQLDRDD